MKERDLYRAIDKRLPDTIHKQSMTGAAMTTNGTPDRYYDDSGSDLWVEYKVLKHFPKSGIVIGAFTPIQLHWMERRYRNSKPKPNVAGIVGLPDRTAVIQLTPKEWREGSRVDTAVSLDEVADWIRDFCS